MTDWPPPQAPNPAEIPPPPARTGLRPKRWMVVVGAIAVAALGVVAVLFGELPAASSSKAIDQLDPGDCFDIPDFDDEVRRLRIIPCDQPHNAEYFDQTTAPILDFKNDAITRCERRVRTAFGGSDKLPAGYRIEALVGIARDRNLGDVPVYCVLYRRQGLDRAYVIEQDG